MAIMNFKPISHKGTVSTIGPELETNILKTYDGDNSTAWSISAGVKDKNRIDYTLPTIPSNYTKITLDVLAHTDSTGTAITVYDVTTGSNIEMIKGDGTLVEKIHSFDITNNYNGQIGVDFGFKNLTGKGSIVVYEVTLCVTTNSKKIYLGTVQPQKIYLGSIPITKAYLGTNLIFE